MEPQSVGFADSAPVSTSVSLRVPASADAVFAVLADHRGWPDWVRSGVTAVEPTSVPETGVGATRTVTFRVGATIEERFVAWDEPTAWAFTGTAASPGVFTKLVERFELRPDGDHCEVTYTFGAELAAPLRPFARPFAAGVRWGARGILRRLGRAASLGG